MQLSPGMIMGLSSTASPPVKRIILIVQLQL